MHLMSTGLQRQYFVIKLANTTALWKFFASCQGGREGGQSLQSRQNNYNLLWLLSLPKFVMHGQDQEHILKTEV